MGSPALRHCAQPLEICFLNCKMEYSPRLPSGREIKASALSYDPCVRPRLGAEKFTPLPPSTLFPMRYLSPYLLPHTHSLLLGLSASAFISFHLLLSTCFHTVGSDLLKMQLDRVTLGFYSLLQYLPVVLRIKWNRWYVRQGLPNLLKYIFNFTCPRFLDFTLHFLA